jgi:hypothetical protein
LKNSGIPQNKKTGIGGVVKKTIAKNRMPNKIDLSKHVSVFDA